MFKNKDKHLSVINDNIVYFEQRRVYEYPIYPPFNPSIAYPEYKWKDTAQHDNHVYDMVRNCFFKLGMDVENYGKNCWNPFENFVQPGNMVLIKPNMVLHQNKCIRNGINCVITHPSVVRAVTDYIIIALKGSGQIIIGDSPMQTCEFETLTKEQGYDDIISFYKNKDTKVLLQDLRIFKATVKSGILFNKPNERRI